MTSSYLLPNFNGATVEVWEWISKFIPHLLGIWLFIHAGIKFSPCLQNIPLMLIKHIYKSELTYDDKITIGFFPQHWTYVRRGYSSNVYWRVQWVSVCSHEDATVAVFQVSNQKKYCGFPWYTSDVKPSYWYLVSKTATFLYMHSKTKEHSIRSNFQHLPHVTPQDPPLNKAASSCPVNNSVQVPRSQIFSTYHNHRIFSRLTWWAKQW